MELNEQQIVELENGLAKLNLKVDALNQARDQILKKLNAAKAGRPPASSGAAVEVFEEETSGDVAVAPGIEVAKY